MPTTLPLDAAAGESSSSLVLLALGPPVILVFDEAAGVSDSSFPGAIDSDIYLAFNEAAGESDSSIAATGLVALLLDEAAGVGLAGPFGFTGVFTLVLDAAAGESGGRISYAPDLSDNEMIAMTLTLRGTCLLYPPEGD